MTDVKKEAHYKHILKVQKLMYFISITDFKCDYWDKYLEKKENKDHVTIKILGLWIFSVLLAWNEVNSDY